MPHAVPGLRALLIAALFSLAVGLLPGRALAAFLPGTADVPLAPGLTADADDLLVFDNPSGRIIQVTATGTGPGNGEPEAVLNFYIDTLPQLGWVKATEPGSAAQSMWIRQGESLTITVEPQTRALAVRFQLSPREPL